MISSQQFNALFEQLQNIDVNHDKDNWQLHGSNSHFSNRKVYKAHSDISIAHAYFRWIWKSCSLPKHKLFFGLLLQDRLSTRDLLTRKNFAVESTSSVLCHCEDNTLHDLAHHFFKCDFSQCFWWSLNMEWNSNSQLIDMLIEGRKRYKIIFLREILMVGCWSNWNHRNKDIYA